MTDHLPECPYTDTGFKACICPALRACEQRLVRDGITKSHGVWHDGYGEGYAAGIAAARDAVAALPYQDNPVTPVVGAFRFGALAAIDALRGES